jgi:hypothetical protein
VFYHAGTGTGTGTVWRNLTFTSSLIGTGKISSMLAQSVTNHYFALNFIRWNLEITWMKSSPMNPEEFGVVGISSARRLPFVWRGASMLIRVQTNMQWMRPRDKNKILLCLFYLKLSQEPGVLSRWSLIKIMVLSAVSRQNNAINRRESRASAIIL